VCVCVPCLFLRAQTHKILYTHEKKQGVGCVKEIDYYDKLLLVTGMPLTLMLVIVLVFYVPSSKAIHRLCQPRGDKASDFQDDEEQEDELRQALETLSSRKQRRRLFWKLSLFSAYLIYPSVSSVILSFFVCQEIDGTYYLQGSFTTLCFDARWWTYLPLVLLLIALFSFGIPALYFYKLYRYRLRMQDPSVVLQLGFLYHAYTPACKYYEIFDLMYKLVASSMLAWFPRNLQMPFALVVITIQICVVLIVQPYIRKGDDRLQLLASSELLVIVMIAFTIDDATDHGRDIAAREFDAKTDLALSLILLAIVVLTIGFFAYLAVNAVFKRKRQQRAKMHRSLDDTQDNEATNDERGVEEDSREKATRARANESVSMAYRDVDGSLVQVDVDQPLWEQAGTGGRDHLLAPSMRDRAVSQGLRASDVGTNKTGIPSVHARSLSECPQQPVGPQQKTIRPEQLSPFDNPESDDDGL
jgi:ABC-type multidrug transport system fused ATPase/permease subunit